MGNTSMSRPNSSREAHAERASRASPRYPPCLQVTSYGTASERAHYTLTGTRRRSGTEQALPSRSTKPLQALRAFSTRLIDPHDQPTVAGVDLV